MPDDRIRDEHERDLRAIAHLVARIRPEWHQPGVMAVLRDCPDDKLADTAIAALVCARDRKDQTSPTVIALDGSHWRVGTQPDEPAKPQHTGPSCWRCGLPESMHPEMQRRIPGWCEGFTRRPHALPAARPDETRNIRRQP